MFKLTLIILLIISFEIISCLPELPYLDLKNISPDSVPACNSCLEKCKKSSDPYCSADCCWLCIPGRGGNCHCC